MKDLSLIIKIQALVLVEIPEWNCYDRQLIEYEYERALGIQLLVRE